MATFTDAATQNRISQLLFTAADQNYGPIQIGDALVPINNMGGTAPQPYQTPSGFVVKDVITDANTGFKLSIYKNDTTNEVLVVPNGSDGWSAKDWASNTLYLGRNQWEGSKTKVLKSLETVVGGDATTKIYIGGQSLGGALAQYLAVDYLDQKLSDPNFNPNNVALVTYAAPGVGQAIRTITDQVQSGLNQISTVHYTTVSGTDYELVNQLGGAMIGGDGTVSYLNVSSAAFNNGGPGYLHRIPFAFYDSLSASGGDFTSATVQVRREIDVSTVQKIGSYVATIGANGQMTDSESLLRVGTDLLVGAALGKPGEITGLISEVANQYGVPPALSTIAGIGTEILSKFLLISNPVGWVRMVAGMVGVSNIAHIGAGSQEAAQVQTEFGVTVDLGYADMKQLKTDTGENYVAVTYDTYTRYLMKNAQGEISDSRVSNNGTESCMVGVGTDKQGTLTWDASTASGTLVLADATHVELRAGDTISVSDQAWTIDRPSQGGAATVEIVAQRIKNTSNVCGITIDGKPVVGEITADSVTVDNGNGTNLQVTTAGGDPVSAVAAAQQSATSGGIAAVDYTSNIQFGVEHEVMSARYLDTLTGVLQKEIVGKTSIDLNGISTYRTETTIYQQDGKTPAKYISDLQNNDGFHETRVVGFSNGIKYDVMLGYDAQGEPYVSNVLSINDVAPTDSALATSELQSRGMAYALASGDNSISLDAGVNGAISEELRVSRILCKRGFSTAAESGLRTG